MGVQIRRDILFLRLMMRRFDRNQQFSFSMLELRRQLRVGMSGAEAQRAVSSANILTLHESIEEGRSLMNMRNRSGPSTEP